MNTSMTIVAAVELACDICVRNIVLQIFNVCVGSTGIHQSIKD